MALVLVVDDEFGILRLLEDVLSDEGHTVIGAVNGRQAIERMNERRPDIVVTDFMMPVMDGAGLIEALATMPELANVPVILMSSLPEATVAERCPGYTVFVRKPFKIFNLLEIISGLINGASQS